MEYNLKLDGSTEKDLSKMEVMKLPGKVYHLEFMALCKTKQAEWVGQDLPKLTLSSLARFPLLKFIV